MAKTRFRNLFRSAGSRQREPEAPNTAQPPGSGAKQPRLFAEPAVAAENAPQAVAPEVPAPMLDPSRPISDASLDATKVAPPVAFEPEATAERSLAEYVGAAVQLRDTGRFEEAETLLTEAVERFPAEPRPRVEWALLAHARRDWAEAVQRWEIVRTEFPNDAAAYALGAIGLREIGRVDEAESLLAAARESFPDNLGIASENAWLATHRRDWAEALRRWGRIRKQFPDHPAGYTGMAMIQRELRWFDEADAMLTDAVERFPTQPGPGIDYARLAEARGDWPEAAARWEAVRERFPDHPAAYASGAGALRELGRLDEAEALLAEAVERFPNDAGLAIGYAAAAHRRRDWEGTVRRCETYLGKKSVLAFTTDRLLVY